MKTLKTEKP